MSTTRSVVPADALEVDRAVASDRHDDEVRDGLAG